MIQNFLQAYGPLAPMGAIFLVLIIIWTTAEVVQNETLQARWPARIMALALVLAGLIFIFGGKK